MNEPTPLERKRRWPWLLLALPLVVAGALALQIEDWSRDLTVNHARTAADHTDERLRPLVSERSGAELREAAVAVAGEFGWERAPDDGERLHFVRTSALFRFRDDVWVWVEERDGRRWVQAEARSRVGKGDLGQNPRTLRKLLGALRAR